MESMQSHVVEVGVEGEIVGNDEKHHSESDDEDHRCSSSSEIVKERRLCCVSVEDLESGVSEMKVHLVKVERDCRICHLSMEVGNQECAVPIELGCSCKDDLAAAHKHCAEAWFKIKGNKTCEICGSIAKNVAGADEGELERWNETSDAAEASTAAPVRPSETRSLWQGHRFLNFLLACMVFAFVISWLFHFNVPS